MKFKNTTIDKWNYPIIVGIIVGLIVGFSMLAVEYGSELKLFRVIVTYVTYVWNGIKWFFSFSVPMWIAIILVGIYIFIRKRFIRFYSKKNNGLIQREPEWINYKEDVFDNVKYSWEYKIEGNTSTIILTGVYCVYCDYDLVQLTNGWTCPKCNKSYKLHYDKTIRSFIRHNIKYGKFEKKYS